MSEEAFRRELRRRISYSPDTGAFVWRVTHIKALIGKRAGGDWRVDGYPRLNFKGRCFFAHRLIWFYVTGEWPLFIDHINGIRDDNRFCNLRNVSRTINAQNTHTASKSNATGFLGVSPTRSGKFCATIGFNYTKICIGTFSTPQEAFAAYLAKKRELHPGCTI